MSLADVCGRSLGLFKAAQLEGFVSVFTAVLLLERFDEGLVILMRILVRRSIARNNALASYPKNAGVGSCGSHLF